MASRKRERIARAGPGVEHGGQGEG
jgi:hypothetical protein